MPAVGHGDRAGLEAYVDEVSAPTKQGPAMRLAGIPIESKFYLVGKAVTARGLFQHRLLLSISGNQPIRRPQVPGYGDGQGLRRHGRLARQPQFERACGGRCRRPSTRRTRHSPAAAAATTRNRSWPSPSLRGAWQDDGRPGNGGPLLPGWEVGASADVGPHLRFGRACLRGLPG